MLVRNYPEEAPFTDEQEKEFRQLLKDRPDLKRSYKEFKMDSLQELRGRVGRSPWLSEDLDKLYEIAVISGI